MGAERPASASKIADDMAAAIKEFQRIDGFDSAEIDFSVQSGKIQPLIKSMRIRGSEATLHQSSAASEAAIQEASTVDPSNIQEVAASQLSISNSYYAGVLAQARSSFVAAITAASVGALFFLSTVLISVLFRQTAGAVLSGIGGAIVEVIAGLNFWLYSKASAQLDAFHFRLETMQRFLIANSICLNVGAELRAETMAELVREIAGIAPRRAGTSDAS
jgi:hypothetical protein